MYGLYVRRWRVGTNNSQNLERFMKSLSWKFQTMEIWSYMYYLSSCNCLLHFKYDWWNYHRYMTICYNIWNHKMACGTIQGCMLIKLILFQCWLYLNSTTLAWGSISYTLSAYEQFLQLICLCKPLIKPLT